MTAGSFTLHNDTTVTELNGSLFLVMDDGSRRLVEEGEVLAQGAVIFSLDSTSFMANGQRFEWVSGELDITKNDVTKSTESSSQVTFEHESHANHSSALTFKALAGEISVLQNDIMKDVDAPADLVVAAAGGEDVGGVINGSGNGGYVTILRDGDATIASAGFETRDLAESFMAGNDREFAQDGAGVIWDVTAPTITVVVPENTNDTTPTISGQTDAAPGSTITIVVTDSAGHKHDLTTTVKPDGSYSVEVITPLPEGSFNVDASVSDPAGNTSDATGSGNVDTTAPTITVVVPEDTNDTTPTISGQTDAAPGSTITIVVTDSAGHKHDLTTTVKPDGSYSVEVTTPLPEGGFNVDVSVTDPAGNKSEPTEGGNIDVTAPSIMVVVPEDTNDTTPTISGQTDAAPGSTITIVVTDSAGHKHDLTTTVKPDGSYSVEVTTPLPEGSFNVDASVSDPAGNTSDVTGSGIVDTTAPTITVVVPEDTNDTTPTISGQTDAAPGSTITIVVTDSAGNKHDLTTTVKPDGSYSVEVTTPLPEGSFNVDASVSDLAGNTSDATGSGIVDTTAPTITVVVPEDTNDTTPTISGQTDAAPGSTITIVVTDCAGNKHDLTTTVKPDGSYSVEVTTPLPEGSFNVDASVSDPAGNTSDATGSGIVDTTAP
ncbi:MAG: retention module-containing protein, partial [Aeromonas sp.]